MGGEGGLFHLEELAWSKVGGWPERQHHAGKGAGEAGVWGGQRGRGAVGSLRGAWEPMVRWKVSMECGGKDLCFFSIKWKRPHQSSHFCEGRVAMNT